MKFLFWEFGSVEEEEIKFSLGDIVRLPTDSIEMTVAGYYTKDGFIIIECAYRDTDGNVKWLSLFQDALILVDSQSQSLNQKITIMQAEISTLIDAVDNLDAKVTQLIPAFQNYQKANAELQAQVQSLLVSDEDKAAIAKAYGEANALAANIESILTPAQPIPATN